MTKQHRYSPTWRELVALVLGLSIIALQVWLLFFAWKSLGFHMLWVALAFHPLAGVLSWSLQRGVERFCRHPGLAAMLGYPSRFIVSHMVAGWQALSLTLLAMPILLPMNEIVGVDKDGIDNDIH